MNYLRAIALLVVALAYPVQVSALSLMQLSAHTAIDTFHILAIDQLWNSTPPELTHGINVVVEARRFDVESRPRLDKWIGCGWLLIGTGDIGITPVGLKIWTDSTCHSLTIKRAGSSNNGAEDFYLHLGGSESHRLSVGPDLRVFIDQREIGTIRQ